MLTQTRGKGGGYSTLVECIFSTTLADEEDEIQLRSIAYSQNPPCQGEGAAVGAQRDQRQYHLQRVRCSGVVQRRFPHLVSQADVPHLKRLACIAHHVKGSHDSRNEGYTVCQAQQRQ